MRKYQAFRSWPIPIRFFHGIRLVGRRASLATAVLICLGTAAHDARYLSRAQETAGQVPQRIPVSDIGRNVTLIGRLGVPLGEIITIRGKWLSPEGADGSPLKKGAYDLIFSVSTVDGKRLDHPVSFLEGLISMIHLATIEQRQPKAGESWELRGVEAGRYVGVPAAVFREAVEPDQMVPKMTVRFGFYPEFMYFSRTVVR